MSWERGEWNPGYGTKGTQLFVYSLFSLKKKKISMAEY